MLCDDFIGCDDFDYFATKADTVIDFYMSVTLLKFSFEHLH